MKKIIIITLLAFMLVGCGNNNAKITNGNEVLWKAGKKEFTKNDLYELLKAQDFSYFIVKDLVYKIAELESIDTEETRKTSEEDWNSAVEAGYEAFYQQYYGTKEEYVDTNVINDVITKLMEKDINEDFDTQVEEKKPYKASIAYFDTLEEAKNAITVANESANTFDYAMTTEVGFEGDASEQIYTDDSDLPIEVKQAIAETDKVGILDIIEAIELPETDGTLDEEVEDSEEEEPITKYYLVNLVSKDINEIKDSFIDYLKNETDAFEVISGYLKKYNLKIYDQSTFDIMKKNYGDFN